MQQLLLQRAADGIRIPHWQIPPVCNLYPLLLSSEMSGTRSDTAQPHNTIAASSDPSPATTIHPPPPPPTSHRAGAAAVSDAAENGMIMNGSRQVPVRPAAAQVPPSSSPERALLDRPCPGVPAATTGPSPSGLDVLHTAAAVEARRRKMDPAFRDRDREAEAALALVGLTTVAVPPPSSSLSTEGTACSRASSGSSGSSGSRAAATPRRPPALAAAARPLSARPSTVVLVTPGNGSSGSSSSSDGTSQSRGQLTYVRGVGLVSGELSDELRAALDASATSSLFGSAAAEPTGRPAPAPAPHKTTMTTTNGTATRTRVGSAATNCHRATNSTGIAPAATSIPAATVVTPAPASTTTTNKTKTKKGNGSPDKRRATHDSRKRLVTADGQNKGDWDDDDETAHLLQRGLPKARGGANNDWTTIAARDVPTRTEQHQCQSQNPKRARSDGDGWHWHDAHAQTTVGSRRNQVLRRRPPRSVPSPKATRALQGDGDGDGDHGRRRRDVGQVAKAAGRRGSRNDKSDLPRLLPLPPPQYEKEAEKEKAEVAEAEVADSADANALPADGGARKSPVPPPSTEDESHASGRRRSKRRPKRSVAEIREEFEAKQDRKQTRTKKAKVQDTTGATKPSSNTMATLDITKDVAEPIPTRPKRRSAAQAQTVVGESSAARKKKESKKAAADASAKKATTKAAATKRPKKYEYPRCTTPGCTRQRQGGCAGQCRKHFNEDRVKAGLEVAKTYVKTCQREGCNKLKQWGFGEYCRAHHKEELKQKGELCSAPSCKKQPVPNCDGMCTVHYKKHTNMNSNEKYLFSRTKIRGPDGNKGDWDDDEVQRFYEGMGELSGDTRKRGDWEVVAAHVGTRSAAQCRSKYQKLQKKRQAGVESVPV